MSWLSSIYYLDEDGIFVHVAKHGLDENVSIEVSDDSGGMCAGNRMTNAQAIEMAEKILAFGLKP